MAAAPAKREPTATMIATRLALENHAHNDFPGKPETPYACNNTDIHELWCGHFVSTAEIEPCGDNCTFDRENGRPKYATRRGIFCKICFVEKKVKNKTNRHGKLRALSSHKGWNAWGRWYNAWLDVGNETRKASRVEREDRASDCLRDGTPIIVRDEAVRKRAMPGNAELGIALHRFASRRVVTGEASEPSKNPAVVEYRKQQRCADIVQEYLLEEYRREFIEQALAEEESELSVVVPEESQEGDLISWDTLLERLQGLQTRDKGHRESQDHTQDD